MLTFAAHGFASRNLAQKIESSAASFSLAATSLVSSRVLVTTGGTMPNQTEHLGHQRRCRGGLVLEGGRQGLHTLVVPGEAVNAALNQNQAELGILVLAIPVQVLADGHCLLDEVVHILRQGGCQAIRLQDAQDVVACDSLDLRDAEAISQCHANLRRGEALLGKLADVIAHILWLHLQPSRRRSLVGDGRGGYALALAIHAPHLGADSCGYFGPLQLAAACAWRKAMTMHLGDIR